MSEPTLIIAACRRAVPVSAEGRVYEFEGIRLFVHPHIQGCDHGFMCSDEATGLGLGSGLTIQKALADACRKLAARRDLYDARIVGIPVINPHPLAALSPLP